MTVNPIRTATGVCALAGLMAILAGCGGVSETAMADTMTHHVGLYQPPPAEAARVRVGVPPFLVTAEEPIDGLEAVAADVMTTLAVQSRRFDVVERAQLEQLLREQDLEGIVRPGEMARPGQVRGVDYLIIGRLTNVRVREAEVGHGFGLARIDIGRVGGVGGLDVKTETMTITVDCGVDIRLVDPETGQVVAAHFGEYQRTDEARSMGVDILGARARADADLEVTRDSYGKIFRLALDDAFRKMLPDVDHALVGHGRALQARPDVATPVTAEPTDQPAAPKFCPDCGERIPEAARFCGGCGRQLMQQ